MSENKKLNEEELEKVNGGLSERDFAKYYCIMISSKKETRGYSCGDDTIGPYNTLEDAIQAALSWADEHYARGYFDISYQPVLMLYGDIIERYQKYIYYPK